MESEDEISRANERLKSLHDSTVDLVGSHEALVERLNDLLADVRDLVAVTGVSLDLPQKLESSRPRSELDDLVVALSVLPESTREQLRHEFLGSVPALPPFDNFDVFLLVVLGGLAGLADFLLVGLPKGTKWTPSNEGGTVPTGWLSERVKSWQVSNNNWLAKICRVPYDKTCIPGIDLGLNPYTHRLLTFGHDPSPLGMVFGLMDIISGGMSGVSRTGELFHVPGVPLAAEKLLMAPLLWIGHLASDVATPMGLPAPGWALTQLLRIPAPGAPEVATVADVARSMYTRGYDLRHYMVGGIVPALIEVVIRTYHFVRYSYKSLRAEPHRTPISADLAGKFVTQTQQAGHLKAMLFWGHATAAAINSGKIVVQGLTGSYFSAARAINVAQWQTFAARAAQYLVHRLRDKSVEQIVRNRRALNERWDELLSDRLAYTFLTETEAPRLTVIQGGKS